MSQDEYVNCKVNYLGTIPIRHGVRRTYLRTSTLTFFSLNSREVSKRYLGDELLDL
jgi:hypothetical protein